ncbi:Cwf15/Cwc15 cell cycle control protein [Piedraia hortae CBS 480.64]|uniref:Cwf15/Cwc15 cell cycle control protein n=1 Tax=Piedraia hortae CBS 480.64 TaxID=1314780 RepID=A0A6A7BPJ6_9PEZI|nr:Cwf15/Cwc15 cell cycle control protein [Piedraia hortae CBS 480.64]
MTTAHRPTFDPARGKEAARGEAYHQRLLPAYKTLKYRQPTQGTAEEIAKRDLRAELLRDEAKHGADKNVEHEDVEKPQLMMEDADPGRGAKRKATEGETANGGFEEDYESRKRRILVETAELDRESSSEDSDSSASEDQDDEDQTAELMRELTRIKAERAEKARLEAEAQVKKEEEQRERDIALGNPLLNPRPAADYGVKRRWDDDVVFKNQARASQNKGKEKQFVNDLLRSDFHRRFMDRYVR